MKNIALTLAAALAALTSTAAFIPQANQAWVTNKIDEVVGTNTAARIAAVAQAATNYTDYAVAAAGGVTPLVVTNIAGAVVSNVVPSWARSETPPITQETDPTVPAWAKEENPPEGMTDNALVLTNGNVYTKAGAKVSAGNVGAVETNAYWSVKKGSEDGVGVRSSASGIGSTFFIGYNSFGTIDRGAHFQYSSGGYEDFFNGSVLRMLTGAQLWWLTGAKPWLQTATDFRIGGSSYNGGTQFPTYIDGRVTSIVPPWARAANPPATYTDAQAGAVATNVVRSVNGGVWDAALQVWWTPVMSNGKLTYQATTNVNLNAGN